MGTASDLEEHTSSPLVTLDSFSLTAETRPPRKRGACGGQKVRCRKEKQAAQERQAADKARRDWQTTLAETEEADHRPPQDTYQVEPDREAEEWLLEAHKWASSAYSTTQLTFQIVYLCG